MTLATVSAPRSGAARPARWSARSLTPFFYRAAYIYPDKVAIVHGDRRYLSRADGPATIGLADRGPLGTVGSCGCTRVVVGSTDGQGGRCIAAAQRQIQVLGHIGLGAQRVQSRRWELASDDYAPRAFNRAAGSGRAPTA